MNAKKLLTRFKSSGNKYISLIGLLILATIIIWCFDDIAIYLYGQASDSKGKFLSILVTIIGGFAVFYGLYLNSKRIKEQTRQNDLSDKSNNDKRFGEAIGYLNSDDIGVAIGGVHILNQLAKDDYRYRSIVVNIYIEIIRIEKEINLKDRRKKLIFESIFNDIFSSEKVTFERITFKNSVELYSIEGITFEECIFEEQLSIFQASKVHFKNCKIKKLSILNAANFSINDCDINGLYLFNVGAMKQIYIIDSNLQYGTISSCSTIDNILINECEIKDYLLIESPEIGLSNQIDKDEKIIIRNKLHNNVTLRR